MFSLDNFAFYCDDFDLLLIILTDFIVDPRAFRNMHGINPMLSSNCSFFTTNWFFILTLTDLSFLDLWMDFFSRLRLDVPRGECNCCWFSVLIFHWWYFFFRDKIELSLWDANRWPFLLAKPFLLDVGPSWEGYYFLIFVLKSLDYILINDNDLSVEK